MCLLTIQEVGKEILTNSPRNFYVFLGTEFGIKEKYIQMIKDHYNGQCVEFPVVSDLFRYFRTKRIIPLKPSLYIVRQDESFVSSLSQKTSEELKALNIIGTIVCCYDSEKVVSKFDKYLPDNSVMINNVSKPFLTKYLHQDFPNLSDSTINAAVDIADGYGQAKNICQAISSLSDNQISSVSKPDLFNVFGYSKQYTEDQVKLGVAARDFKYLSNAIPSFLNNLDTVLYAILNTMLELEKVKFNPKLQSDIHQYAKYWTIPDLYYMFVYTYEEIRKLRSLSTYNPENSILFLISLLGFQPIPSPEDLA